MRGSQWKPSMGPRSIDRGKVQPGTPGAPVVQPSMGPRSIDRGKKGECFYWAINKAPSMGPRSIDRGKSRSCTFLDCRVTLQWGLDQSIEEREVGMNGVEMLYTPSMGP